MHLRKPNEILQFAFYNLTFSMHSYLSRGSKFRRTPVFTEVSKFLLGQGWADGLLGGLFLVTLGLLPFGARHVPFF